MHLFKQQIIVQHHVLHRSAAFAYVPAAYKTYTCQL